MNGDVTIKTAEYLTDRRSHKVLRRVSSIVLCIVISSILFEFFVFKYYLVDLSDYKSIYFFFVRGHFVVPLTLYLVVWVITYYGLMLYNGLRRRRVEKKIGVGLVGKNPEEQFKKWINETPDRKRILTKIHSSFVSRFGDELQLKASIFKQQNVLEEYMVLALRGVIVLIFGFISVIHFHWTLFVLSILLLVIAFSILMTIDAILTVLPDYIRVFSEGIKDGSDEGGKEVP